MKLKLTGVFLIGSVAAIIAADQAVVERGPHHRTWEVVREVALPEGGTGLQTSSYVELQGGLHRWTDQGWVETTPNLELFQDGAVARNLPYGAIFAPNLATPNAIDISLPDGQRLSGHLLGLALSENNRSVLIAEVKDCAGVVGGPAQNELTFSDAFTDFDISVKFVLQRDRISQIVTLHQQLPHPGEWDFSENAVLEILSEFTAFPDVRKEPREPIAGITTEHISFSSMEFVTGRAFSLGDEANAVIMAKTWDLFEGNRWFLVEKLPWKTIAPELAKLPAVAKNWRKKEGAVMARNQLRLPPRREARAPIKPIQMASGRDATPFASAIPKKPGYIWDWELVSSVNSNLWKGDTTYYIAGSITIKTNIFEGGCVIKYAPTNSAKLTITGPVTCLSTNYAPIIMTARDDHSVGEQIGSASLSGYYANTAIVLDYYTSGILYDLHDIRISHAALGISFFQGYGHIARNVQLVHCLKGIEPYYSRFDLLNGLLHRVDVPFAGSGTSTATGSVQHVTFNQCSNLFTNVTLYATNSLLVACTNIYPFTGAYNGTNSNPVAVFQTAGAGANYLTNNSGFRDGGTTNIDAALLSALRQLTTYPPIIIGPLTLGNTNLTLSPQASRDSDMPDLGFHYSPIDYALGGVYITNATITITAGTAIGIFSPTNASTIGCINPGNAATLISDGSATNLSRIVRYTTVQEQSQTAWTSGGAETIFVDAAASVNPITRFRFTEWAIPAGPVMHFYGYSSDLAATFVDCQFYGGFFGSDRPKVSFTNCVLHRVSTQINGWDQDVNPTFQNCLFYGGSLGLNKQAGGTWTVKDSMFDRTAVSQSGTITHDYNGYVTNAAAQWLTNSGTHNVFTNTFPYQAGALGRFYQPTNSLFLNAGSTNANLLGLYHYTVLTNNVKETTSIVDIGFHYVATTNGVPSDVDGDFVPDYLEDINGNGSVDSGETDWQSAGDGGLRVLITRPRTGSILP